MKRKAKINIAEQTRKTTSKEDIEKILNLMNITKNENKEKTNQSARDIITLIKKQNNYKNKDHEKEFINKNNIKK